jgi:hypothetical protein
MEIEFDHAKRDRTLAERGLDFAQAQQVFAGRYLTMQDLRETYPEPRFITVGRLGDRMVVLVWTQRGAARRIISMRKTNDREIARYTAALG